LPNSYIRLIEAIAVQRKG